MGKSPEELKREIEEVRGDLGYKLDAIGDRVSPGRIYERKTERVRTGMSRARERVMGSAEYGTSMLSTGGESVGSAASSVAHGVQQLPSAVRSQTKGAPLAAGLVAFGAGCVMAALLPASEREKQAAGQLQQKAQPLTDAAKEAASEVAHDMAESAGTAAEQVKAAATSATAEVKEAATGAAQQVTEHARAGQDDGPRPAPGSTSSFPPPSSTPRP